MGRFPRGSGSGLLDSVERCALQGVWPPELPALCLDAVLSCTAFGHFRD